MTPNRNPLQYYCLFKALRPFILRPYPAICLAMLSVMQILAAGLASDLFAEELTKTYGTQYSTIYYSDDKYFYDFTRKIGSGLQLFSEGQEKNPALAKNRIDRIVEQVQKILEMYPPEFHFKIYIYPSYKELKLIYLGMGNLGKSPIAFYNHKAKAVYVSLVDITDGVLAHEIAHAVINSSFAVPPPARMQEILAQYVDRHLWSE